MRYTDWTASLLAVILGYRHGAVEDAVREHLTSGGPSWPLPHALEESVASTIRRLAGYPDGQVRFFKTGSEACAAAVRIARAVTDRSHVVSAGYHGWHDALLTTPPAWGVPPQPVIPAAWGDLNQAENPFYSLDPDGRENLAVNDQMIAAVFTEPETLDPPPDGYLQGLRRQCNRFGALLIFDECITGGRYPAYTAGRHYGVRPDLTVLSKSLANGWPLACVVGPRELMRCFDVDWRGAGPVYCSGTYAGETAGLAAARATLDVWERDAVGTQLWDRGRALRTDLTPLATETVRVRGPGYRLALDASSDAKTAVMAGLLQRGHLIGTGWNLMAAHTAEDRRGVVAAFGEAVRDLALRPYRGRPVVQPYRQP